MSGEADGDVLLRVEQGIGRITLNRPKAINALTHAMIRSIDAALIRWERDGAVRLVLLDGTGDRGLCAGGDIRAVYDALKAGEREAAELFFHDEYRMNARIARFGKPFVALMDGITMGGGIGVSSHGSHRVVTERSVLAMPEVGIGFVPDVGGTFLLGRAPGELGLHAALTAARLGPADALLCGLADVHVPATDLPRLASALPGCADKTDVTGVLEEFATAPAEGVLAASRGWIDACYAAATVEAIVAALEARPEPAARSAARDIAAKSPSSLKVTLQLVRRARALELEACLAQEHAAAVLCLRRPDFAEGVRAAVIDKDRAPRWRPASLADVTDAAVEEFLASTQG